MAKKNRSGNKRGTLETFYNVINESYVYTITTQANRRIIQSGYATEGAAKGGGTMTAKAYDIDLTPVKEVKKLNYRIKRI